jgi:hypothetical protein
VRGILRRVGLARTNSSKKTPGPRVPLPGFPTILDNFIESIYKNTDPIVNGESARSTVELINGIILSALRCKHVTFPVDRDEYDQLFEELTAGKVTIPRLGQCSATSTLCKGS